MGIVALGDAFGIAEPVRDLGDALSGDLQGRYKAVTHDVQSDPRQSLCSHEVFEGPTKIVPVARGSMSHARSQRKVEWLQSFQSIASERLGRDKSVVHGAACRF